jgi:hypothetical protein
MNTKTITRREAGRLARAYTARVMAEQLGKMTTLDLLLDGSRGRRSELTLPELRTMLGAFEEEIEKLERRAGDDDAQRSTLAAAVVQP